ncbi:MAG: hypothetical protein JXB85_06930 [Anaerolineales bacterium]|nr:hypothetical protein [Anaerolineales bacterium]
MSAPLVWILFPMLLGVILIFVRNERWAAFVGSSLAFLLALAAWVLPIEATFTLGARIFKLTETFDVLGRQLVLTATDQPLLALIYISLCFWFAASATLKVAQRLVPLGLIITGLVVAALAVEPFLYAALLIEIAVLLATPLLLAPDQRPGRGLIRFLIFQTMAMPFILFSGWLLAGIEADPGNLALVLRAGILLGLGFLFLLGIFPFHTWIPLLTREAMPYAIGFVLWMFTTSALLFGAGFVDRYTWLRTTPALVNILTLAGTLMVASGGLLAAFQNHLGRMLGYAVIVEIGFSLLALSLGGAAGIDLFFLLLIPRMLALGIWAMSLSILKELAPTLTFSAVKGVGRAWPFAVAGIILAQLSLAGFPMLASFPTHQAVWEGLAQSSPGPALWVLLGCAGLIVGAIRSLAALMAAPEGTAWGIRETWPQRIFLVAGWLLLVGLGNFPQWTIPLLARLPGYFEHLGF